MLYCREYECQGINRNTYESTRSSFDDATYLEREYKRHNDYIDNSMNATYSYHDSHDIDNEAITYDQIINSRNIVNIDYGRRQTPLDVFLKVRGFESYAQKFYCLGARTVRDLKYLEESDFREIGLDKNKLLIKID